MSTDAHRYVRAEVPVASAAPAGIPPLCQAFVDFVRTGYRIFWLGDMTTIRGQLALGSLIFAGVLWRYPDTFTRPIYAAMVAFVSVWLDGGLAWLVEACRLGRWIAPPHLDPIDTWAAAFAIHGVLAFWRLWDPVPRPLVLLAVNAWGFLVWFVSTVLINISAGELSAGTAIEITILLNAFAALARTGLNDDKVGP